MKNEKKLNILNILEKNPVLCQKLGFFVIKKTEKNSQVFEQSQVFEFK
jgi:hypothetical protein